MHGVKRTRVTPQAAEAKRLKELSKIEAYVSLQDEVLAMKKAHDYSPTALAATTRLLDLNPEFYTIWNYRRQILSSSLFPSSTPEEIVGYLKTDLKLTMAYLQVYPKVYWIWTHRKWCLENVPVGPGDNNSEEWRCAFWKGELALLEALLDADSRNFHAWGYRRYVLAALPTSFTPKRTPQHELQYTRKKIEANFSNFSAWHCRTKILGELWAAGGLDAKSVKAEKDKEFELVRQALWTDPGDQSGWLYHRWLIGKEPPQDVLDREIASIQELHETEPDSKWCMNALAHCYLLQSGLATTDPEQVGTLHSKARALFNSLEVVDPDRRERYRDFAAKC